MLGLKRKGEELDNACNLEDGSSTSMQHTPADRQRAEQRLFQSLSPQVKPVRLSYMARQAPPIQA